MPYSTCRNYTCASYGTIETRRLAGTRVWYGGCDAHRDSRHEHAARHFSSRPLEKSLSRAHDLRARRKLDVAPPAVSAEERRRSAQQRLRDRGARSHQTFEPRLDERWSTHANMRRSDGFTRSDTVWNR